MNIEDDELPLDLDLEFGSDSEYTKFISKTDIKDNKEFNFFKNIKNYTCNLLFNTLFFSTICICNFVCAPLACFYYFCSKNN
tara:strand:+ start:176 stop:421 length:246 start_codon:yes stop_codon:yes gene_type:complete